MNEVAFTRAGRTGLLLLAICGAVAFLGLPSAANASPGPPCMIEPWYCGPGGGPEPPECMIEPWECEPGPAPEPREPEICVNGLGRYIVVFHDWVEDPEALARAQVVKYEGELGFIYKYALKGYSAGFTKAAVAGVRQEPTVDYVEADRKVTIAGTSDASEWEECPLDDGSPSPPAQPKPGSQADPEAPAEGERQADPGALVGAGSPPPGAAAGASCPAGKVRRGGQCVRKRSSARRRCAQANRAAKQRCLRRLQRQT